MWGCLISATVYDFSNKNFNLKKINDSPLNEPYFQLKTFFFYQFKYFFFHIKKKL